MFNFTVQDNYLHSNITGTLLDPAIILSISKDTNDVTFQKIGEYDYLKEKVIPKYDPLRAIYRTVLISLNTLSIDKHQQPILLNHITNVTLSLLTKQFVQQLFSNDVRGCRETINDMYHANKQLHQANNPSDTLTEPISVTHTQWENAFNAFKASTHTATDILTLVQSGLNMFDGSSDGKTAYQMLALFNKAHNKEALNASELNRIQTYYKTLEQDNFHTELQATEIYTNVDYV